MSRLLFVNLPVTDLAASVAFFTGLGFDFNPQLTDASSACLVVNDEACVMLMTRGHFATFHRRGTAQAGSALEVLVAMTVESRAEVDRICTQAFATGGSRTSDPSDQGVMYTWGFADLDGHVWELVWLDEA